MPEVLRRILSFSLSWLIKVIGKIYSGKLGMAIATPPLKILAVAAHGKIA